MQNLDKSLIQTIGGWQLTIAIILAQTRRAMNNLELASWTGLTDKTLARHLDKLDASGRITRTATGWMLTQGFQLELFSTLRVLSDSAPNTTPVVESEFFRLDPIVIINDSAYLINSVNNNNKDVESENLRLKREESEKFRLDALNAALRFYMVVGTKKAELLACAWVTAEYVRAHVEFAMAQGRSKDHAVGVAIIRMLDQIDQPARRENGHIENCKCSVCVGDDGMRSGTGYADSAFAEYINRRDDHERVSLCFWQDELEEVFESGPYKGQHRMAPRCGKPCKAGSHKWCEEHYEIGTATYDSENEAA